MKPNYTLHPKPLGKAASSAYSLNSEGGQIFILALIVLSLIIVSTLLIVSGSLNFFQNSKYTVQRTQALNLAEAGVDKAVASLNISPDSYNPDPNLEIPLGSGTFTIALTSNNQTTRTIEATGYIPNKANSKSKKTIKVQVSKGIGSSFNYGVQVGDGGLELANNVVVNGSVFSNGNVILSNNAYVTGDVFVAGGSQPLADQQHDCTDPNCVDFVFGKVVNGNSQLDVGQSFTPTVSGPLNKIALKLKKTGTPTNVTVRILGDNGGLPNKNLILGSGVLSASLVTSQYGYAEVTFTTNPILVAGTVYWIVLDTSNNTSNYWTWSYDSLQGYTAGSAKWSANWQGASPVWTTINGDLSFKVYMGGVATKIEGANGVIIYGEAHANTMSNLDIRKHAYYQVESSLTVNGSNCTNNTRCHPNSPDPAPQPMPLSDSNIAEWKDLAAQSGVFTGSITTCPATLAAGKYIGSINLPNDCNVTVGSPIWVTGDFSLNGKTRVKLDPSLGGSSGVLIVDNFITMGNGNLIAGNGQQGSYLILVSEFNSRDDPLNRNAITIQNSGNTGILYSNLGSVLVSNLNYLVSITAWKLILSNNVIINYDQGLAGAFFSSGPSGSFNVIKGSYQSQ